MCAVCGCSGDGQGKVSVPGEVHTHEDGEAHTHEPGEAHTHEDAHSHEGHSHTHSHEGHSHAHTHEGHSHADSHAHAAETSAPGPAEMVVLERRLLDKNDRVAEGNRAWLAGREVLALNLMSSPGAGKTTLLVRALREIGLPVSVIEGDQESSLDAERIRATGTPVVQINTGTGCHLDAEMVRGALDRQKPAFGSVLFVENVGNLVCPALFDLGEHARVVLLSVTEGSDKPIKYPHMFRRADLVVLTKIDLLPYVDFDEVAAMDAVRAARPGVEVVRLSARTGEGMEAFLDWTRERLKKLRG